MINLQLAEKPVRTVSGIEVVNIFETIQGEGPLVGTPAVFIRTAGCNLQCPGCDTDYTSNRETLSESEILKRVTKLRKDGLVVITGGEPLRQPIDRLINSLLWNGFQVQLETNGTLFQEEVPWYDIVTVCSPKTPKLNTRILNHIDYYKYVLSAGDVAEDGLPSRSLGMSYPPARPYDVSPYEVFVQPCDSGNPEQNKDNVRAAINSCLRHGYRLCLQTHKIIGME